MISFLYARSQHCLKMICNVGCEEDSGRLRYVFMKVKGGIWIDKALFRHF